MSFSSSDKAKNGSVSRIALIVGGCAVGLVITVGAIVGVALRKKKRVEPRFSNTYLDDGESVGD